MTTVTPVPVPDLSAPVFTDLNGTAVRAPGADPAADLADVAAAIRALITAGERFRHAVAEHLEIGISEALALSCLFSTGPMTARQLAIAVGLTPPTVTALLDRLEAADLAVRRPHPSDRRKSVVALTARGEENVTYAGELLRAAVANLDEHVLPQTTALLSSVTAALSAQTAAIKLLTVSSRPVH